MEFKNNRPFLKKSEALNYVELLCENAILSEKGKSLFVDLLDFDDYLTRTKLLYLLVNFFQNDFEYRTGLNMYEALLEKRKEGEILDIEKEFEKKYFNSKAYLIEAEIENEEVSYDAELVLSLDEIPSLDIHETDIIHPKRSVLGKTITRTLFDLQMIGLIDDQILNEVLSNIDNEHLFLESAVIDFAAKRLHEKENFTSEHKKQLEILKQLKTEKFLSEESFAAILSTYEPDRLKTIFEIFDLCPNVMKWSFSEYFDKNEIIHKYYQVFKDFQEVIPNFKMVEFSMNVRNEEEESFDLAIHFKIDHLFYGTVIPIYKYKKGYKFKVDNQLLVPINKFLKENISDFLCFSVQNYNVDIDRVEFYLLKLNEKQRDVLELWEYKKYFQFIGGEEFDSIFSPSKIQKAIMLLEEIGFFDDMTKQEIKVGIRNCVENAVSSFEEIVSFFPNTLFSFLEVMEDLSRPYEKETIRFFEFIRINLIPQNILDTYILQELDCLLSFEVQEKRYHQILGIDEDYYDMLYKDLLLRAAKDLGVNLVCFDNLFYMKFSENQLKKIKKEFPEFCERIKKI